MDINKQTILLHCNGCCTGATGANQRYVNGKEIKMTVDSSTTNFRDIVSQVPQVEGSNHVVKISYKSPSTGPNTYVVLEDDAGLVKMFDECRAEPCIELYSVLEKAIAVAREDDKSDPPKACLERSLSGDLCTDPLTAPSEVKKRKRKSDSKNEPVKKAKKCEGLASYMASVMNSTIQALEAGYEIIDSEELWSLLEKLEAALRQLRLQREKEMTSSPIEIEEDDDDHEEDLIKSLVFDQNKVTPEKSALPESSIKHNTVVIITSQSSHESEQAQPTNTLSEVPSITACSPLVDNVACTGEEAVEVHMPHSESSVNSTLHKEASIELFPDLIIAENVPAKDKIALDLHLSMLKAGSKAIVMFLKHPFDENTMLGLQTAIQIIQVNLTPEFDKYFGTKPREQIQGVCNFVSRIQTFQSHDYIAEAELICQNNIEKCKNAVKYAEKDLHLSLNEAIKACAKSRRSKERFRDIMMDFCKAAESLDCALRSCNRKREKRRNLLRDYVRYARIFEGSRCDLLVAEESHTTEVLHLSEKIHEERKQKLLKEAEVLLATMMS